MRTAWVALAGGATSAALVIVLLPHTIAGPDGDTVWPLVWTIALSALVGLTGAVLARRRDCMHPVALEGFELALVSLSILGLIAVFYYLILGPGWS